MPVERHPNGLGANSDERLMSLIERALERPPEEREQFVREACVNDASLMETVLEYVSWDERMKDFLLHPACQPPADEPPLQPGQLLDDRFRIVRRIASGGMGVVYEARDEKLERRIAIKCAKAGFHSRLPPEVRHASEINHPNICKTWEIHTATGSRGEFDFFTMEFVEGRTLSDTLRDGPLPVKEARNIAIQICAGLTEAHRRRVIHGDLKSNNVLLAQGTEGVRAVIMDFGLARPWSGQDPAVMSGELGGTIDYMAPELWRRARPSAASDVYALGVILHEMACGRMPFSRGTPLPERMERRAPILRHPWGRIIARCLEPDPAQRCADATEVSAALAPFPAARWALIGAAVVIAATAGAAGYRTVGVSQETIRLAVMPFSTDAETKSLSDGLLEDTAERLRGVKDDHRKLTVIPPRDAVRNQPGATEQALARIDATHVLTGDVRSDRGGIAIHALLTDARTRIPLKEWRGQYRPGAFRSVPVALAGLVTGTLNLRPLATTATVNAAAYPDFAAGLGLVQRDSGLDAGIPLLAKAVAADPDSPLTHANLADAQARKYRLSLDSSWLDRASQSLHEAEQRNPDLALVWLVSGRINEYEGYYEAAESDLRRALQIDPKDGDVWRRLGQVYQENNRYTEAAAALGKAIESQPSEIVNYQDLCWLYTEQAKYGEAIEQCRRVVRLAPDFPDGHFDLALPYFASGDYTRSDSEFLTAIRLDPRSSKAIYNRAFTLTSRGRPLEAIPLFQSAIEIGPVNHLLYSDLGTAYRLAGFPAKARKAYQEGLALAEKELGKNPRDAVVKAQLAYLCARMDQRGRAQSEAIQARQMASDSVEVAWWLVLTWDALGQSEDALAVLEHVPDDMLRRLTRDADLAELRRNSRFTQLMAARHIQ